MKIVHVERLIDIGPFSASVEWRSIEAQILEAIKRVDWPPGSGIFQLNPELGKRRGAGNGVTPIKNAWKAYLKSVGWSTETRLNIEGPSRPGPMDATYPASNGLFCVEWETGNISSSHRAINKMTLGLIKKVLVGGALILPSREMYPYLTDRISNYAELEPYFPLWRSLRIDEGFLDVIVIEHDTLDSSVPRIPKGTSGRALGNSSR